MPGGIFKCRAPCCWCPPFVIFSGKKKPRKKKIINNLGQAYLDLGDDKKAEQYFLKCVSSYKYYPDANLALAYIYNSRGNKSAAINYVENSLRGAWSSKADNLLSILKPDAKMMDYVRHRYKQPEFFNFDKYPMLPQCKNIDDISGLEPQYVAYKMMIDQLAEKYSQKYRDARQASDKSVPEKIAAAAKVNRSPHRPFGAFGIVVLAALKKEYKDRYQFLDSFLQHYSRERNALNDKYEEEYQKIEVTNMNKWNMAETRRRNAGKLTHLVMITCLNMQKKQNCFRKKCCLIIKIILMIWLTGPI